jgi:hypothetical protein
MTPQQLTESRHGRPLTDPKFVADILRLCVADNGRISRSLYVLLCDDSGRLVQPVAIDDVPEHCDEAERERALDGLLDIAKRVDENLSLLIAVARPGDLEPTDADRQWVTVACRVFDGGSIRLLGVHLVTQAGSRALWPEPSAG